jgi:KDO2-lipid IV(A) lauroyltransferase
MAKLSHYLEYLVTLTGVKLAQALSMGVADRFGAELGSMAHAVLASRRRIAADNLRRAFGPELSEQEIRRIVREVFRNTGRTLIEFARMRRLVEYGLDRLCVSDGLECLQQARAAGKGAIAVSAHFGNFELFGAWVATRGHPTDFVVGVQHNEMVNRLLTGFRREIGVGMIPVNKGLKGVFRSLQQNRIVALLADQHAPSGVVVEFFGRRAATPKGPAAFAVRSGAPIIPFVIRRERYDRHVLMAGTPIFPPESGNDEQDMLNMTQAYTTFFEDCIRRYPDQWLWTHRRWKV